MRWETARHVRKLDMVALWTCLIGFEWFDWFEWLDVFAWLYLFDRIHLRIWFEGLECFDRVGWLDWLDWHVLRVVIGFVKVIGMLVMVRLIWTASCVCLDVLVWLASFVCLVGMLGLLWTRGVIWLIGLNLACVCWLHWLEWLEWLDWLDCMNSTYGWLWVQFPEQRHCTSIFCVNCWKISRSNWVALSI